MAQSPSEPQDPAAARKAALRRTLDEVFGDVLPTVTRDEIDEGHSGAAGGRDHAESEHDQWYRDNRPPHHG